MSRLLPSGALRARGALCLFTAARSPSLSVAAQLSPLVQAAKKSDRTYSQPPVPPPAKSPSELASLPYFVRRTPSAQLPVYKRTKSGGTRKVVLVKKVDGDLKQMVEDLVSARQIPREDVRINPTTQHIETKGTHYDTVKSWLLERGF